MNVTVSVYKREMNQAAQEDPPILGTKTSVVSPVQSHRESSVWPSVVSANKLQEQADIGPFLIAKWNLDGPNGTFAKSNSPGGQF